MSYLTYGKVYDIIGTKPNDDDGVIEYLIESDDGRWWYDASFFISLKEARNRKLEIILS